MQGTEPAAHMLLLMCTATPINIFQLGEEIRCLLDRPEAATICCLGFRYGCKKGTSLSPIALGLGQLRLSKGRLEEHRECPCLMKNLPCSKEPKS